MKCEAYFIGAQPVSLGRIIWIKGKPTFSTFQFIYCFIKGIEDYGEFGNSNHVKNLFKMGRYPGNRCKLFIFLYFLTID